MHDERQDVMEERLRSIFQNGLEQPRDNAFRIAVLQRIEKRLRFRRIVLASSIAAGTLIAFVPAYELTLAFSNGLAELVTQLDEFGWQPNYRVISFVAISALLGPLLARLLED